MGCHIAKEFSSIMMNDKQKIMMMVRQENRGSTSTSTSSATAAAEAVIEQENNNMFVDATDKQQQQQYQNYDNPQNNIVDTQTQEHQTNNWLNTDSQPIENVIWGRLYPKRLNIKSLGIRKRSKIIVEQSSRVIDLCKDKFSAGRDPTNDLTLTLNELQESLLSRISKVHFRICKDVNDFTNPVYIEDISRNGTYVNGQIIGCKKRQILVNDDIISVFHPQYKVFVYKDLSPNEAHGLPRIVCEKYHIARKLGSGACGVVRLVYNRKTCQQYALKHIQKNQLLKNPTDPNRIMNEVKIMMQLEHPCVIKMKDIIESNDSVCIVLELMKGGDLLTRIINNKHLTEKLSKLFFIQMCYAVKYLHDKNITHRDIKPDNVLLESDDEETLVKVSDFGLSKFVQNDSEMRTLCGTPLYVAPEVLITGGRGSYTKKVDIWSLGVVLFTCLSGTLPFSNDYGSPAIEQIKLGKFTFRSSVWRSMSQQAKSLICKMLNVNPINRYSIDEVLADKWLRDDKEILNKASKLMGITLSEVQQENLPINDENIIFCQPAAKRRRVSRTEYN